MTSCPAPADAAAPVQLLPLGDSAVVLQFGEAISPDTQRRIQAVAAHLQAQPFAGMVELVPAFTTLTVYYQPWLINQAGHLDAYAHVARQLQELLPQVPPATELPALPLVEVPVCYGGAFGPDLELVAQHTGLAAAEVVALHASPEYLVYMIGFAPGFPYLGGLDARLATPRREQPRPQVPAGSVGIGGPQTGIYSLPTPGGWQLIGRTPLRLFTPVAESPSLLRAGQRLRFVPISEREYAQLQQYES
jgi:inhibitor of KinA